MGVSGDGGLPSIVWCELVGHGGGGERNVVVMVMAFGDAEGGGVSLTYTLS